MKNVIPLLKSVKHFMDKKTYDKIRYEKQKEKLIQQSLNWQKNNPEKAREIRKRHYEKSGKERMSEWSANNKEKIKKNKQTYREKSRLKDPVKYFISDKLSYWKNKYTVKSDLTTSYLVDLIYSQNCECYYTGAKLIIPTGGKVQSNTASLDRLDPLLGYIQGNVVWCCFFANTMKGNLNEDEFYKYIKNILEKKQK